MRDLRHSRQYMYLLLFYSEKSTRRNDFDKRDYFDQRVKRN